MNTAIAIRGVKLAGNINRANAIQPKSMPALLKKSFMQIFISNFYYLLCVLVQILQHLLLQ